ncbi:MAG: DUF4830 domain-containing protein [Clostridia bacterium]|nr:DUF4830 domain-containing protein [Clostridia bacterium]
MKHLVCYAGILISIVIITLVFLTYYKESSAAVGFLESFGWSVDSSPAESAEFKIPEEFDAVYENYNLLQKEAGLDLEPYRGRNAVRYTYIVRNYPGVSDDTVRANVITVDGEPVGGDICTVAIDGFMYSLNSNSKVCFTAMQ